jgi:uncharacterized protein DUF6527
VKLIDLDPTWIGYGGPEITRDGQLVLERHGIGVGCNCPCGTPDCWLAVYFKNPLDGRPPPDVIEKYPLWNRTGDTFETLTLRPSLQRRGGCDWHGFLTDGVFAKV